MRCRCVFNQSCQLREITGTLSSTMPRLKKTKKTKKPTSRQNHNIGKAGQLAAMAELALLGYMVARPEIDKGDDVLVVNEHTGQQWRLQVKGSTQQPNNGSFQPIVDERCLGSAATGVLAGRC